MNMTLVENLESELRRLDMVMQEALDNQGVENATDLHGGEKDQFFGAKAQVKMVCEIVAKAKVAEMSFDAYEKVKKY
jgi:hypothetical protein